jgi:hypothetical protein
MDESGRVFLVGSTNGDLWYDENVSGSWSDPTQITHNANITDSIGTALRTFYGIAASNGTAYVAYVTGSAANDVLLMTHAAGGSWSSPAQISPKDAYICPKFGVSIVANAGRVGISYARGHTGYCKTQNGISGDAPFLFIGAPGRMKPVGALAGANPDCFATSLAKEGNLFRFATTCDHPVALGTGQLYYKAELIDVVGPKARLFVPAHSSAGIQLRWTGRDPQPGSGVAYYQLQVRVDGGPWKTVLAKTRARSFTYVHALRGHRYTFRVRAHDRAGNWGAWVSAGTSVRL